MREWIARLRVVFEGLSPREQILVGVALVLLGGTFVWLVTVQPVLSATDRAQQRVATAEQRLLEMTRLRAQWDEVSGRLGGVEQEIRGGPGGNLFTTLESLAQRSAIKVDSMEPQAAASTETYRETKVSVVLKGVTLTQMVSYLDGIQQAPERLSVKSLRIRTRSDKPELLDVNFTVSSFEPV
jgi:type II secretory pathway component PulM